MITDDVDFASYVDYNTPYTRRILIKEIIEELENV